MSFDPKPSSVLSSIEVDAVIGVMLYHATPDVRHALMAHCPVAYAKLCGSHPSVEEATLNVVKRAMAERSKP